MPARDGGQLRVIDAGEVVVEAPGHAASPPGGRGGDDRPWADVRGLVDQKQPAQADRRDPAGLNIAEVVPALARRPGVGPHPGPELLGRQPGDDRGQRLHQRKADSPVSGGAALVTLLARHRDRRHRQRGQNYDL